MAGVDQFGGNNDVKPVLEAYQMGVKDFGEAKMRARMEISAVRLLKNIFRTGLFENPYLDPQETKSIVGKPEFMTAGYEAQLKSIVMLKNKNNALPLAGRKTVYVPKRFFPANKSLFGPEEPARTDYPINIEQVKKYFKVTDNPDEADAALVFIQNPNAGASMGGGYDKDDVKKGGNGYIPISLQYDSYTANDARETSIAGGDPLETFTNRSYKGKTVKSANFTDAELVSDTKAKMKGKPVIVTVNITNPMVFSEIEKNATAILLSFGVQDQAIYDIISGKTEPSALLPTQMPANMTTVEKQAEDVPFDMNCYKDSEGHVYDFAYGMNWKGVIKDSRVSKYRK